jgi:hypothetical protein
MREQSLDITPSWWPLAGEALHVLGTCLGILSEIDLDTPEVARVMLPSQPTKQRVGFDLSPRCGV